MSYLTPAQILEVAVEKGKEKANTGIDRLLLLSFMGGMYISLGFLGYLRVAGAMPAEWSGLATLLGACVFPVGLIAVLLAGGELITGNMLVVAVAWLRREVSLQKLARNWVIVTIGNLLGALFTAYVLGHLTGLTEGAYLAKTVSIAVNKVNQSFLASFCSGIGCNIFVCLGVWLCYGAKDMCGKILAIWFPVMTFVAIGFQHVVANMFIIPAALFAGAQEVTWGGWLSNFAPVYLGNLVGGAVVLGLVYSVAFRRQMAVR